jgi:hypothetical protein
MNMNRGEKSRYTFPTAAITADSTEYVDWQSGKRKNEAGLKAGPASLLRGCDELRQASVHAEYRIF